MNYLKSAVIEGFDVYHRDIFNEILPNFFGNSINNVYNIYSQIDMVKECFDQENCLNQGITIGYSNLKIKIEQKIIDKIDFNNIKPLKIAPSYIYSYHHEHCFPKIIQGIRCLNGIGTSKIFQMEEEHNKKFGIQVFDIDYLVSDKILVKKIKEDRYRVAIGFSAFFDLISINANVVIL